MTEEHKYAEDEDVVISFCYLYGPNPSQLPMNEVQLSRLFGILPGSWGRRKSNFKFLDGKGGLCHPADLSKKVWADFSDRTQEGIDRHRDAALKAIEKRTGK